MDLSVDGVLTDLEEPTGSLVYRVVQEALRNVVRHASATPSPSGSAWGTSGWT